MHVLSFNKFEFIKKTLAATEIKTYYLLQSSDVILKVNKMAISYKKNSYNCVMFFFLTVVSYTS